MTALDAVVWGMPADSKLRCKMPSSPGVPCTMTNANSGLHVSPLAMANEKGVLLDRNALSVARTLAPPAVHVDVDKHGREQPPIHVGQHHGRAFSADLGFARVTTGQHGHATGGWVLHVTQKSVGIGPADFEHGAKFQHVALNGVDVGTRDRDVAHFAVRLHRGLSVEVHVDVGKRQHVFQSLIHGGAMRVGFADEVEHGRRGVQWDRCRPRAN